MQERQITFSDKKKCISGDASLSFMPSSSYLVTTICKVVQYTEGLAKFIRYWFMTIDLLIHDSAEE